MPLVNNQSGLTTTMSMLQKFIFDLTQLWTIRIKVSKPGTKLSRQLKHHFVTNYILALLNFDFTLKMKLVNIFCLLAVYTGGNQSWRFSCRKEDMGNRDRLWRTSPFVAGMSGSNCNAQYCGRRYQMIRLTRISYNKIPDASCILKRPKSLISYV